MEVSNRAPGPSLPGLRRAARRTIGLALAASLALAPVTDAAAQSRGSLIRDAEIEATLRAYADPIFAAAGLDTSAVQVHIINDKRINAFVSNGMQIFIHTGLLTEAKTPNEVIGVIAHETGHITGGHRIRGVAAGIQHLAADQRGTRLVGHNTAIKIVHGIELAGDLGAALRARGDRQKCGHHG